MDMPSSLILFGLLSAFAGSCTALNCRACTMSDDDDTACRDHADKAYSKKCEAHENRCMTVRAQYTHSRLGSYVLRRCAHSTVCFSDKPDIPELNAVSIKQEETKVDCCEETNCNSEAHGNAITGNLVFTMFMGIAAWLAGGLREP